MRVLEYAVFIIVVMITFAGCGNIGNGETDIVKIPMPDEWYLGFFTHAEINGIYVEISLKDYDAEIVYYEIITDNGIDPYDDIQLINIYRKSHTARLI